MQHSARSTTSAFDELDVNRDGVLSKAEIKAGLSFPMWVVPIKSMIEVAKAASAGGAAKLPTHEVLKEQGKLVEWQPGMRTLFFSHTWLGASHPDPAGVKCKLIYELLQGIRAGKTRITAYWMALIIYQEKGISARKLTKDFADGYVWMDYLSIPQLDKTSQGLAIASITGYVGISDLFIVLSGAWAHEADGSIRDVRAWGERGWCRMENLANSLSPLQKSFIVAQSATNLYSYGPAGMIGRSWYEEVVGRGNFAVEGDKLHLGPSIYKLIQLRRAHAEHERDLTFYRFLVAMTNKLLEGTGVQEPEMPLEEWLQQMRFSSTDDEKDSGLTPLRYAVIANRADLVRQLIDQGADVEAPVKWVPKKSSAKMLLPGQTILATACVFTETPEIVQMLLAAGAKPKVVDKNPPFGSPFLHACVSSNAQLIEPLLEADPNLWHVPHAFGLLPFEECLMVGKPHMAELAITKYRERLEGLPAGVDVFLNVDGRKGIGAAVTREETLKAGGANLLILALNHIGDTRVLKMALDAGFDPNGDTTHLWKPHRSKLPKRILGRVARFFFDNQKHPIDLFNRFSNLESGPLHVAALTGNIGAVDMLIAHGAKVDSQMHKRKLTPLHLAAAFGHTEVVESLLRAAPDAATLAIIKDGKGRTPARLAKFKGYAELAERLNTLAGSAAGSLVKGIKRYQIMPSAEDTESPPKE